MVARLYHRLRNCNPVPNIYQAWEEGEQTRDIPIEGVIGGHSSRHSHSEHLVQLADSSPTPSSSRRRSRRPG